MRNWVGRIVLPAMTATVVVTAQTPRTPVRPDQQAIFRTAIENVSTDVIARDARGVFVPDLRKDEFRVFEDGVEQVITVFQPIIGGRAIGGQFVAPAPVAEGLILPPTRQAPDSSGRIFIILIDDMHLQALDTPRVRRVLEQIRDELVHDGDLVGIVSTGYSSIAVDLSYDYNKVRFTESIKKVMGSGQSPTEIINSPNTAEGPAGLRYNAHVAFSTAYDLLERASQITNRRKSFIYVSGGYDFNPFKDSRYKLEQERYALPRDLSVSGDGSDRGTGDGTYYQNPFEKQGQQFAESDLVSELAYLTRAARRANVVFYTVDPRGLMAGPDINLDLSMEEWRSFVQNSVSSLQVLGEETGGFCICNTNDFKRGLQRIDAETSDYYILAYNSNNPDPLKVRRRIRIEVTRPDVDLVYREEYTLRRPARNR